MGVLDKLPAGCHDCQGEESCPMVKEMEAASKLPGGSGGQLVFAATSVFIVPLLMAIIGTWAFPKWFAEATPTSHGRWEAIGLLVGLSIGVGLAKLLVLLIRKRRVVDTGSLPCRPQ